MRFLLAGSFALVFALGAAPATQAKSQPGPRLRVAVDRTDLLLSDYDRFVVAANSSTGLTTLLDTGRRSRARLTIPSGCRLIPDTATLRHGELLLLCSDGRNRIVRLADRSVSVPPSTVTVDGVPRQATFSALGRSWLKGDVPCDGAGGACLVYVNRADGSAQIRDGIPFENRDLDAPDLRDLEYCSPFAELFALAERYERPYVLYTRSTARNHLLVLGRCGGANRVLGSLAGSATFVLAGRRVTWGPDRSHRYLYSKGPLPGGPTYRWSTRVISEPASRTFHTRRSVFVAEEIAPEVNQITSLVRLYEARLPRR